MMDIVEELHDLHKQATQERSHFYVGNVTQRAADEIVRLRARLVKYQDCDTMINQELKDVRAKAAQFEDAAEDAIEYAYAKGFRGSSRPF